MSHTAIISYLHWVEHYSLLLFFTRCTCGCCHIERLNGALEHRCCREVHEAFGKVVFEGLSDDINCITLFNDYKSMTSNVVLTHVGPLLRGKDGRQYRQRAGQTKNG